MYCVSLIDGYPNEQIARQLKLTARTIDFYILNVQKMLNCQSREDMIHKLQKLNFAQLVNVIASKELL